MTDKKNLLLRFIFVRDELTLRAFDNDVIPDKHIPVFNQEKNKEKALKKKKIVSFQIQKSE